MHRRNRLFRPGPLMAATLVALAVLLGVGPALARGSVRLARSTVEEKDGIWKLKFTINYGSMPHLAHVPMIFSFKPTALFERSLTDASPDRPIETRKSLHNQEPLNQSVDVGFADMSGKMFKITKFKMKLSRKNDFVAGEYQLTVKLASGGQRVGSPLRITLRGKNKVINRKSMVFEAKVPAKKKDNGPPKGDIPEDTGPMAAEDMGPDLSDIPDIPDDETDADPEGPEKVPPKQGGCGCWLVARAPASAHGWLALAALCGAVALRRRRE